MEKMLKLIRIEWDRQTTDCDYILLTLSMYPISQISRVAEETRNICYCGGIVVVPQLYSMSGHRESLALGVFIF